MNKTITVFAVKVKRLCKKIRASLSRFFNINFSLKRKGDPEHPLVTVNVKGEIPREVVAFLSILGGITLLVGIWKIVRKFI